MCRTVSADASYGSEDTPVVRAVVSAMADVEDVEPSDLDLVLADYLDADALDTVFDHDGTRGSDVTVTLTVHDFEVVVESPGEVTVTRPCETPKQCGSAFPDVTTPDVDSRSCH